MHLECRVSGPPNLVTLIRARASKHRVRRTDLWIGTAIEYGSDTPREHEEAEGEHVEGDAHDARVLGHFTVALESVRCRACGVDRSSRPHPSMVRELDV